jgi:hypothetical protein
MSFEWDDSFFGRKPAFADPPPQTPSGVPLLDELGDIPFWRGELSFTQTLEPLYAAAADLGAALLAEDESAASDEA